MVFSNNINDLSERIERLHRFATAGLCISSIIHEINNYLGAIMAYSEILQLDTFPNSEEYQTLQKIIESIKKTSSLLNALITIARAKDSFITMVEIPELIDTILLMRKYHHKANQIKIEREIEINPRPIVLDLPQIQLALLNVLKNAEENLNIESKDEDKQRLIRITCSEISDGIQINIYDNGPPLSTDVQEEIFKPYFTTKDGHHLGLGLTIAKRIIEDHKGTINYTHEEGFTLWLPFNNGKWALIKPSS